MQSGCQCIVMLSQKNCFDETWSRYFCIIICYQKYRIIARRNNIGFSRPFLLSFIICIVLFPLVFLKKLLNQTRNQEFFRPGKFSWNQGTSINIHLQHEKKGPPGGNFPFFPLETLKNFILNEKFHLTDDDNQYISSANQDTFF